MKGRSDLNGSGQVADMRGIKCSTENPKTTANKRHVRSVRSGQDELPAGRNSWVTDVTQQEGNTRTPLCGYTIVISPRNDVFGIWVRNKTAGEFTGTI